MKQSWCRHHLGSKYGCRHGNTSAVGIRFFGADKADYFGIGDLLAVVVRNVLIADDLEGVGAFDTLTCVGGVGNNALVDATEFIGV